MGIEACRLKMILGWAQIIERRFCEKVVWPIGVLQYGRGEQEVGRPSIFVVEAVYAICCTGSRLRKARRISRRKPILGPRCFGPAKVAKERVGGSRFGSRLRGLHGARGVKNSVKGPKTAAIVPEMSVVVILPPH
jgi:hypothetical protein